MRDLTVQSTTCSNSPRNPRAIEAFVIAIFQAPDGGDKSESQSEEGSDDDEGDGDDAMGVAMDADKERNAGADEADMDVDEAAASDAKAKHKGKKDRQRQQNGGVGHVRAKQSMKREKKGGKKRSGNSVESGSSAEQGLTSSRNQDKGEPNARSEKDTPGKRAKKKGGKKAKKGLREHPQDGNAAPLGDAMNGSTNGVSAAILNGKSAGNKARKKGRPTGGGENILGADGKNEANAMEVDSAVKRKPTVSQQACTRERHSCCRVESFFIPM